MRTKLLLMIFTLVLLIGTAASVSGQAPTTFLYQGRLTDANDQPITASTSVSFAVVSGPSGMVISYYDTTIAVTPDDNGVFTVELGPMPETVFSGSKRYLSVIVGGTELLPRQLITSVPYAARTAAVPGVAYKARETFLHMATPATNYVLDSIDIVAPTSGYVDVSGGGYLNMWHANGTKTEVYVVVSDASADTDFTNNDGVAVASVGSTNVTGLTQVPFYVSDMYPVTAGTHRFYVNLRYVSGASATNPSAAKANIRAVFYPTSYGVVGTKSSGAVETESVGLTTTGEPDAASSGTRH